MKNSINFLKSLTILSLFLLMSCGKKDTVEPTPTTGGLSVSIKISQKSTGAVIPDNKLSNWTIEASLYSDAGALLKTQTFNSGILTFTDLNPGNYKVYAKGSVLNASYGLLSLTGGASGGQVQVGKTASSPDMYFYY